MPKHIFSLRYFLSTFDCVKYFYKRKIAYRYSSVLRQKGINDCLQKVLKILISLQTASIEHS